MNIIQSKNINLRLVELEDAEFIVSLRQGQKGKYLSRIGDVSTQKAWILDYKVRESQNKEFYYIIESKSREKLGTIRIYDFRGESFCWGSWVVKDNAPIFTAIESALCMYQHAFETLGFKQSHFDVRKENIKVVAFHKRFGAKIIKENELDYFFSLSKEMFMQKKMQFSKLYGGGGLNKPPFALFSLSHSKNGNVIFGIDSNIIFNTHLCIDFKNCNTSPYSLGVNLAYGELRLCA